MVKSPMSIDDYYKLVTCDIECFENYLLVMFGRVSDGKVIYFEKYNDSTLAIDNILSILNKYTIVTFNGIKYDMLIIEAAVAGFNNKTLKKITNLIIPNSKEVKPRQPWQIRKQFGFRKLEIDHIDVIEVAPLKASLKIYAGRLHLKRMKDMPIHHSAIVKDSDLEDMREYCEIDNENTSAIVQFLKQEINLRDAMSKLYDVDLRSKSDSQIAEAVIKSELESKYDISPKRTKISSGTIFYYKAPDNLSFKTKKCQELFELYKSTPIILGKSGHPEIDFNYNKNQASTMDDVSDFIFDIKTKASREKWQNLFEENPEQAHRDYLKKMKMSKYKLTIGDSDYTFGMGGIHSCEKSVGYTSGSYKIEEIDVESFYPRIILNNRLFPKHIGPDFLPIYGSVVDRRLEAKRTGDSIINESLKIVINGSFGKFGSKWSFLYSPDLLMQVTITGQLTLLMLIEELELNGIRVISANTDGIVTMTPPELEDRVQDIVSDWEVRTDYKMDTNEYESLHSRDVNNYIAVSKKGVKGKGQYSNHRDHFYYLRSNPNKEICIEAVKTLLVDKIPIEHTVRTCEDITKFLIVRTVNGGALKDGKLIGKAIRWYHGSEELDAIYYKTSGNKVPKSDNGVPLMTLPEELPKDLDYNFYIDEANSILKDIGYL